MLLEKSILTLLVSAILYFIIFAFNLRNKTFKEIIICTLMYIYGIFVVHITIFPIPLDSIGAEILRISSSDNYINLIPFNGLFEYDKYSFIRQVVGNIVMFIPLGLLLPLLAQKYRNIKVIIKYSLFTSLLIEIAQLIISIIVIKGAFRVFDIDDLIMNVLGGIIGYVLYSNLRTIFEKSSKDIIE